MTKTTITTVLAAVVALATAPSAFAASYGDTVAFKVSTAGLDLRNSRDAQSMLRRVETAAQAVCGGAPYANDLGGAQNYRACVSHNVGQALNQMGDLQVSETGNRSASVQTASR